MRWPFAPSVPTLEVASRLTLPELLGVGCRWAPNSRALNQWTAQGWRSLSNQQIQATAQDIAQGLRSLPLEPQLDAEGHPPRVALLMHSDLDFCLVDLGGLMAHWVTVPIDLTETLAHIVFILNHSASRVLVVSGLDLLAQITPYLWETPHLQVVIVAEVPSDWKQRQQALLTLSTEDVSATLEDNACLQIPLFLCHNRLDRPCPQVPPCIGVRSLAELRQLGQQQSAAPLAWVPPDPQTLATLIYTPSATGELHGVMLSHGNLAANALAAFTSFPNLGRGRREVALSFLPLTHIFARVLLYGHLSYGHSVYFTTPNRVAKHLQEVRPTIFATVPLLLEKVHSKVVESAHRPLLGQHSGELTQIWGSLNILGVLWLWTTLVTGWERLTQAVLRWATRLAEQYELGQPQTWGVALQRLLAHGLVYWHWRRWFGGRLRYLLTGGAALDAKLANFWTGAGLPVFQGYGLTESCIVSFNRQGQNRAGTVGLPIPGAEIRIAADGEVWVRSPYTTRGYYRNPEATAPVLTPDGWFRTGDRGEITSEGFLKITGSQKPLFKLSTGKYVTPLPLEQQVQASPLVAHAIAVGAQHKFCAMLIFPHRQVLEEQAQALSLERSFERLLQHPKVLAWYQALVDEANQPLPPWSTVKRFRLVNAVLTQERGLLQADGSLNRDRIHTVFAAEIQALYESRPPHHRAREPIPAERPEAVATVMPLPIPVIDTRPSAIDLP